MHVLHAATMWVLQLISQLGYLGLAAGMFGQAIAVPLPSEVMMSFSGYLAWSGKFTMPLVIAAGTAGDTLGALVAYGIGFFGGRPLVKRFGRLFFVRSRELERADRWFAKYGARAVFVCKLMPGIRAIASFPAGVTKMAIVPFVAYTLAGSVVWCTLFSFIGYVLGKHWYELAAHLRPVSFLLLAVLVLAVVGWLWMHFRAERKAPAQRQPSVRSDL